METQLSRQQQLEIELIALRSVVVGLTTTVFSQDPQRKDFLELTANWLLEHHSFGSSEAEEYARQALKQYGLTPTNSSILIERINNSNEGVTTSD